MQPPLSKFGANRSEASLGLIKGLRGLFPSELAISTQFQPRKRKDGIQLAKMLLKYFSAPNETGWREKGLTESQYAIGTLVPPL